MWYNFTNLKVGRNKKLLIMADRKTADCRKFPSEMNCSVAISGSEEEVLKVATRHAIEEHGHEDTPELAEQVKGMMEDEE